MSLIILYLLSDISPWDYWNSFNDLKESVIVVLNDHVIDRHKYRTTEEAHKYRVQNTNSPLHKKPFSWRTWLLWHVLYDHFGHNSPNKSFKPYKTERHRDMDNGNH